MTVVCAIKDPVRERVIITSNTTAVYRDTVIRNGPKWHLHEGWGFGTSGDGRAGNIAEANKVALLGGIDSAYDFCQRWMKILEEHKFDLKPAEGHATPNSCQDCLLVSRESIWIIDASFSFVEIQDQFYAQGSGQHFAIGAAHALRDLAMEPDEIINRATAAAIEHSDSCRGPIWIGQVK